MSFARELLIRFRPWSIASVFLIVRLAIAALTMVALVVPGSAQFWETSGADGSSRNASSRPIPSVASGATARGAFGAIVHVKALATTPDRGSA